MSAFKRAVRTAVLHALTKVFGATREPLLREPLFRLIRRADDRTDSWTRDLMKRTFDIDIGRLTYGAFKVDGSVAPGTRIGAFCSVAPGVRLGGSQHPTHHVSTHPFLYLRNRGFVADDDESTRRDVNRPVVIEDDVWLGANAVVMPGVTVGRGAVVGAGAVVTKDVEPYGVALGVPAKVVARRVSDGDAEALASVPWPQWDDDTIRQRLDDFYDVPAFLERYGPDSQA